MLSVLVAVAGSVPAFHEPDLPLADEIPFHGDSYAAWRVLLTTPASVSFEFERLTYGPAEGVSSFWVIDLADGGVSWVLAYSNSIVAAAHADAFVGDLRLSADVEHETCGADDECRSAAAFTTSLGPGERLLLVEAARAGGSEGTFRLFAPATAQVRGTSTGAAFYHEADEFDATASAIAEHPLRETGALLQASIHERVRGNLFGFFEAWSPDGTNAAGYDGPDGAHDGGSFYAIAGGGPGDYRFRTDHSVAGSVWAFGADVAIP